MRKFIKPKTMLIAAALLVTQVISMCFTGNVFAANDPIGCIDYPANNASVVKGTPITTSGWYLSSGNNAIHIWLDGALIQNITANQSREDVYNAYPAYGNHSSGWSYSLDTSNLSVGSHRLEITSDLINMGYKTIQVTATSSPIGNIDTPSNNTSVVKGSALSTSGWYLSNSGGNAIHIWMDGAIIGNTIANQTREDVYNTYPAYGNHSSGWSYSVDTSNLSAGSHRLEITSDLINMGYKTIQVTAPTSSDDYGNDFSSAYNWSLPSATNSKNGSLEVANDVDMFKFTAPSTGTYTFSSSNTTVDVKAWLYNSSQNELTNDDDSAGNTNFRLSYSLTQGQVYYLKVSHYNLNGAGTYTVNASVSASVSDDYGNDFSSAYNWSLSSSATNSKNGSLEVANDVDNFRFTAPSTGSYTFNSSNISVDVKAWLYNSSQSELTNDDDSAGNTNFSLSYNLTQGQVYYLKVSHYNLSGTGTYTVNITPPSGYTNLAPLLYVGIGGNSYSSNTHYAEYTTSDLENMLNPSSALGSKEFVILGGDVGYGLTQCVTQADINSISTSGSTVYNYLGATDSSALNTFKSGAQKTFDTLSQSTGRTLDDFAQAQVNLANRIWSIDPSVKVWFSLPYIPDSCIFFAYKYNSIFKTQLVDNIKNRIGTTKWSNNVLGFYYGSEAIIQWYTKFDVSNTTDFNNPVVNNMAALSTYVHNYGKKFLWIPYYRDGSSSDSSDYPRRLAYVSCRTNIFDYVDLQPSYLFNSTLTNNLNLIKKCVQNNTIVNASGNAVVSKTSNTQIGVEMEIDSKINTDSQMSSRYNQYVSSFSGFRGTKHITFYCGERNCLINNVYNPVKSFCNR